MPVTPRSPTASTKVYVLSSFTNSPSLLIYAIRYTFADLLGREAFVSAKVFVPVLTVVEERSPLHRNVTTTEVGNVATFLLSDMSSCVTGQIVYADSGLSIMGV